MAKDTQVDCHAGHRGEESPRALREGGHRQRVMEVLDQWIEASEQTARPTLRVFKVRLESGRVVVLVLDEATWEWTVRG